MLFHPGSGSLIPLLAEPVSLAPAEGGTSLQLPLQWPFLSRLRPSYEDPSSELLGYQHQPFSFTNLNLSLCSSSASECRYVQSWSSRHVTMRTKPQEGGLSTYAGVCFRALLTSVDVCCTA